LRSGAPNYGSAVSHEFQSDVAGFVAGFTLSVAFTPAGNSDGCQMNG
jgi:hypothetical protein